VIRLPNHASRWIDDQSPERSETARPEGTASPVPVARPYSLARQPPDNDIALASRESQTGRTRPDERPITMSIHPTSSITARREGTAPSVPVACPYRLSRHQPGNDKAFPSNQCRGVTRLVSATAWIAAGLASVSIFGDVAKLKPKTGLAPFAYTNSTDALPNYVAGAKWGTQTEPIRTMQLPLPPEESLKHIVLPDGFTASLFAAEPDIIKPICLAWDERGRLWIAETIDYPNDLQPVGEGHDRIRICEDTNGDGRADQFTVFADKLSIPTGMCFANGGLIVLESGRTLFLKDANGDDRADERRVLFSGWGMGDTHATASNLRYGPDNWIWGTVGYSGFDGVVGGKPLKFGMGVFRFKPDGSELEFIRSTDNNTWGLGIREDGQVFGSTANRNASWHMPIPNRFYESVGGGSASRLETIADSQAIHPITEKVRQVDQHGMYTAGAGHAIYTARAFPSNFWNRIAFVTEPTGHLIGQFALEPAGAGFAARNLGSFLASDDEWFAPVVAEVGPDGALWVLDWYNYIVQHNPVPVGFRNGKGNAYETRLRDKEHGRIFRIAFTNAAPASFPNLSNATPASLVARLTHHNQLWRMHAQRLLVEHGQRDIVPALLRLLADRNVDEIGLNVGAVHALWTLQGLGAFDDADARAAGAVRAAALDAARRHPSAAVRRAAVSALPHSADAGAALVLSAVLDDPDAPVRLAALLVLAECPETEALGAAVHQFVSRPENAADRWLRDAAISAAARHTSGFLIALLSTSAPPPPGMEDVIRAFSRHAAGRTPADVVHTLTLLPRIAPAASAAFLDGLILGWPEDRNPELSAADREALATAMKSLPGVSRDKLLVLAQRWGLLEAFPDQLAASIESLRTQLATSSLDDTARLNAARNWIRLADQPATLQAVLEAITPQTSPRLATGLIGTLGESKLPEAGRVLVSRWSRFSPAQKRAAVNLLLRRAEWSEVLLESIAAGGVLRTDLGPENWQQLRSHRNPTVATRARELSDGGKTSSTDREEILRKLLPVASQPGDASRGKEVFVANCAVCHRFAGTGAGVGPELTGIAARTKEDVLAEVLDPNRSVEANYRLWNVTMKSGDTFSGRLDSETQTSIELLDLTSQKHTLPRSDIAALESSNLSIMPTGFEALGEKDLAALLAYLAAPAAH